MWVPDTAFILDYGSAHGFVSQRFCLPGGDLRVPSQEVQFSVGLGTKFPIWVSQERSDYSVTLRYLAEDTRSRVWLWRE